MNNVAQTGRGLAMVLSLVMRVVRVTREFQPEEIISHARAGRKAGAPPLRFFAPSPRGLAAPAHESDELGESEELGNPYGVR